MSLGRAIRYAVLVFVLFCGQVTGQLATGGFDVSNPLLLLNNFGILTFDNFFSDLANLFWGKRRAVCGIKMLNVLLGSTNFDVLAFANRDDSVMILPEAGIYRGRDSIAEYVTFANNLSPFVNAWTILSSEATVVGYNGDGQCEYSWRLLSQYTMEKSIVEDEVQFAAPVLSKLFLDYEENYLRSTYIFYTPPFLQFFFSTLATQSMAEFVCDTVLAQPNCAAQLGATEKDCVQRMLDLSLASENLYVDGDTFGCRILHAAFAKDNPTHCAHVSVDPFDTDPNGQLRCSESLQLNHADFFSEAEIKELVEFGQVRGKCARLHAEKLIRSHFQRHGVDPSRGYTLM